MIRHRTVEEVKRYDVFKMIVTLVLIVILFFVFYSFIDRTPAEAVAEGDQPAETETIAEVGETPTVETGGEATETTDGALTETETETAATEEAGTAETGTSEASTGTDNTGTAETSTEATASTELAAPTLNLPGAALAAGSLALTGTGAPGSQVEIMANGKSLGTAKVGADGTWNFDGTLDEPGDYELVVNGLDADGATFASTKATTLSLTAPAVDATLPTIDLPEGELPAGAVTLTGTGAPGSEVEVVVDGESLGTTTVGDDGTWTFDANLDKAGDYEIVVNSLTADSKVAASADPITISPTDATPEITLPTFELPEGELNAGEVALTGTGIPGSEVEIMADGESLGMATVDEDGTWRFTNPFDKAGPVEIVINALDNRGRIITSTNASLYTIPAPAEPTDEATAEPTDEATAEPTDEATAEPEIEITAPTITSPRAGTDLAPGRLALQGTGTPGSQVEIMIDGESVGTATVRSTGRWTLATTIDDPGDYELVINGLDEAGEVAASSTPRTLALAEPEAATPEVAVPTLDLPAADVTAGKVTLTGTGEPGSEVEIVVDGQSLGTANVDEDGTWRLTGAIDEPGEVEIVVNALDAQGRIITSTDPRLYTISGSPAESTTAPTLASPLAGASLLAGRQTFRGTGEPGSEVEVVVDGEVIGTATVRSNGTWFLSAAIDEPGEVEVTINALDEDGEITTSSEPVTVTMTASAESTTSTDEEAAEPAASTPAADETGLVCEEEYIVVADDWLSKLADKYFGDLFLYPAIVTATSEKNQIDDSFAAIDNPDVIEPGWKLCIVSAEAARELVAAGN